MKAKRKWIPSDLEERQFTEDVGVREKKRQVAEQRAIQAAGAKAERAQSTTHLRTGDLRSRSVEWEAAGKKAVCMATSLF